MDYHYYLLCFVDLSTDVIIARCASPRAISFILAEVVRNARDGWVDVTSLVDVPCGPAPPAIWFLLCFRNVFLHVWLEQ